ncbi:Ankyrin repeat-containing protein [Pyrenophora tritici-repentis]|nr:Ankyrin repeat-containing protein [Pyrenophora tritici-repentis]
MPSSASEIASPKWCLRLNNPYPAYGDAAPSSEATTVIPTSIGRLLLKRYDQSQHLETLKKMHHDLESARGLLTLNEFRVWASQGDSEHLGFLQPNRNDSNSSLTSTHGDQASNSKIGTTNSQSSFDFGRRNARLQLLSRSEVSRISSTLSVLEELQHMKAHPGTNIQVLYCFCTRGDRLRNNAASVLKTWLHQLIQQRPYLTEYISSLISTYDERYFSLERPVVTWDLFRIALKGEKSGTTYCILDGLHELDDRSIENLLYIFDRELPREDCTEDSLPIKVLVTSRGQPTRGKWSHINLDVHVDNKRPLDSAQLGTVDDVAPKFMIKIDDHRESDANRDLLAHVAAYRQPPTIEQLQWVLEGTYQELKQRLESCRPSIHITPAKLVVFCNSDTWFQYSALENNTSIHSRLAHKCLEILSAELACIDMEVLDFDYQDWKDTIQPDLAYAIEYWAEHVETSEDSTESMLNKLVTTFSQNCLTINKWWSCYVQMVHWIPLRVILQFPHTTIMNIFTYFGFHALFYRALESDKKEQLEMSLEHYDCFEQNPLSYAILKDDAHMVNALLNAGVLIAKIHVAFAAGSTIQIAKAVYQKYKLGEFGQELTYNILGRATRSGNNELLSIAINLLISKSKVSFLWSDTEFIKWGIAVGRWDIVQTLLLTITRPENTVEKIICYATLRHEKTILRNLLSTRKVDEAIRHLKISNISALCGALENKCPEMVKLLITDENVCLKDIQGMTPLQVAVAYPNIDTLVQLLDRPTFTINKGSVDGGIALNLVLHSVVTKIKIEYLTLILQKGARIQYENFGITALHVAAELGRPEVMEVLLEQLSDAEVKAQIDFQCTSVHKEQEREDFTALAIAAMKGHGEIVKLLLGRGAKKDIKIQGKTAAKWASEAGHEDIVKLFQSKASKRK